MRSASLWIAGLLCAFVTPSAWSQETLDLPGNRVILDANGVDILSGTFATASPLGFKAPAAGHLNFQTVFNGYKLSFPLNVYLDDSTETDVPDPQYITFTLSAGGDVQVFGCGRDLVNGRCNAQFSEPGSYLEITGAHKYLYVNRDGIKYYFDQANTSTGSGCADDYSPCYFIKYYYSVSKIVYPSGEAITFLPTSERIVSNGRTYLKDTIRSNLGYSLVFTRDITSYPSTGFGAAPGSNWIYLARNGNAADSNIELFYGGQRLGGLQSTVANTTTTGGALSSVDVLQSDDLGREYKVHSEIKAIKWCSGNLDQTCNVPVDGTQIVPKKVVYPSGLFNDITHSDLTINGTKHVTTVSNGRDVWTYQYSRDAHTITDPLRNASTYSISPGVTLYRPTSSYPDFVTYNKRLTSFTDQNSQVFRYTYVDSIKQHLVSIFPEGNEYRFEIEDPYRSGNVERVRLFGKDGAQLNTAGYWRAKYPATCPNNITCNKPNWIEDARGSRTEFIYYDAHGGTDTVTFPADAQGQRKRVKNSYEAKDTGDGILYRLQEALTCFLTVQGDCTGTKSRTTYTYWANTFLPETVTESADDSTQVLTTTYGYDASGRVIVITDSRGGKTFRRYDAVGRLIGEISPSTGQERRLARRIGYDLDDRVLTEDSGTVPDGQDGAASLWDSFQLLKRVSNTYDSYTGAKIQTSVSGTDKAEAVTQFSYDKVGRLLCTAIRMDPLQWDAQTDACVPQVTGANGPDRVTKNVYDAAGHLIQVRQAVGVKSTDVSSGRASEQAYATYSYTPNGKQEYVIDANGNRAQFAYDGFDRLWKWYFPSSSRPTTFNGADQATALISAGSANSGDYEEYGYDANGNRTSLRKRDGRTFIYTFDALNRVTKKQVPKGCVSGYVCTTPPADTVRDVYYGYDLQGRQLYARFDSESGEGITNEFDGFGRQISTKNDMDGTARKLSFQYDAAANRTQVIFPDTQCFNYTYDALNRLRDIYQNGVYQSGICQTGSGVKTVSLEWNAQGQLWHHTRGAVTTTYGYDGISRLQSLSDALPNAGQSVTLGFTYNAANQILQRDRSNDAYRFNGYANADRAYTPNGLNQYAQVGTNTNRYDSNGSLIEDGDFNTGANRYGYDAENRLVTSELNSQSTISLRYDPLGRLFKIFGGGTGTTQFLYDGDQLVAEYAGNGALLRRYVHGTGEDDPLLWYEGAGLSDRRSLQIDQQGSIVSVAYPDATASIYSYDEYGNPNSGQTGRFQYTGQAWIPELGLYYYKARMYAPKIGRFLQTDPIGYKDQINLYAYVANDPVNGRDPTGESCTESDGKYSCKLDDPGKLSSDQIKSIETSYTKVVNEMMAAPDTKVDLSVDMGDGVEMTMATTAGEIGGVLVGANMVYGGDVKGLNASHLGDTITLFQSGISRGEGALMSTLAHEGGHGTRAGESLLGEYGGTSSGTAVFNRDHQRSFRDILQRIREQRAEDWRNGKLR